MDWFRSWHGAPADPKWKAVARITGVGQPEVVALVWALLDRASSAEDRGSVAGYDCDVLADTIGSTPERVAAVLKALEEKGVLAGGRFSAWEKRQPKSDDSAPRMRRYRARKRDRDVAVTGCDGGDAVESDTESDSESDSEKDSFLEDDSGLTAPPVLALAVPTSPMPARPEPVPHAPAGLRGDAGGAADLSSSETPAAGPAPGAAPPLPAPEVAADETLFAPAECDALVVKYDLVDVRAELARLVRWTRRRGAVLPEQQKAMVVAALRRSQAEREGSRALLAHKTGPPLPVSPALAAQVRAGRRRR